jgi:ABC-2 type transport system ATP-binding protein
MNFQKRGRPKNFLRWTGHLIIRKTMSVSVRGVQMGCFRLPVRPQGIPVLSVTDPPAQLPHPRIYTAMNGLQVSGLTKTYGTQKVVDNLSFQVDEGEIFGLIGPNGAGKSTTMMMIMGLLKADSGTVSFDGQRYNAFDRKMRRQFGMVPQELAIYPELTAIQNLRFFGKMNGVTGRRLQDRVDYVLDLTGLTPNAEHTPSTFSGGMSRRLNFGIALLHEPRFVVLDEPTVGIDPQSRSNLLDCVRKLSSDGVGILYASHYMDEVEAICSRVAIIDRGQMLRQGTLDQLLDRSRMELRVTVGPLPSDLLSKLREVASVNCTSTGETNIQILGAPETQADGRPGPLRVVLEILEEAQIPLRAIESQITSLETLFLSLTGRTLRD